MAGFDRAAIRNRIQESLAPIEGLMKANRKPEITGAAKSQAEKKSQSDRH